LPSGERRSARTSPSTFLFLPIHLSNSPGTTGIPLPHTRGSRRSPRRQTEAGRLVTLSVRSFAGAPSRRKVGGAPSWGLYRGGPRPLSTDNLNEFQHPSALWIVPFARAQCRRFEVRKTEPRALLRPSGSAGSAHWSAVPYRRGAALAPHSCSVVCIGESQ
jgi:hypothetical protein